MTVFINPSLLIATIASVWLLAGCTTTPPAVSDDGLHLVTQQRFDELYHKPGVSMAKYTAIRLEPCSVTFKDNWLRAQNSNRRQAQARVTEQDRQMLSDRLAHSCNQHFKMTLKQEPAYKLVEGDTVGETVLQLRPSIIELDITAPDLNQPGITDTYTTSSGEMTLLLEARDAASGEVIARAIDRKKDITDMRLERTNRATNTADANRYLRSWTRALRDSLDAARTP